MGDDRDEREKLSWSELDKLRDRPRARREEHPRGRGARERQARERRSALRDAESLFSGAKGGEQGAALARALRDAHGSPGLEQACRDYVAAMGVPTSVELLSIFLDSGQPDLLVPALEQLLEQKRRGRLEIASGLGLQLRALAEHPDDDVAGLSEDLLA